MTAAKQKVLRFAVSIRCTNASPSMDAVLDMIRYSGASLASFGRRSKLFFMNMEFRYMDTNIQAYRVIHQARWASFGFDVFWNAEYTDSGELMLRSGAS